MAPFSAIAVLTFSFNISQTIRSLCFSLRIQQVDNTVCTRLPGPLVCKLICFDICCSLFVTHKILHCSGFANSVITSHHSKHYNNHDKLLINIHTSYSHH